jgi:peptide-methionine (S)-S-oxide reductase
MSGNIETAVLGGGCFWCLDAVYRRISGVITVTSGYSGGNLKSPSYEEVCGGKTGHAEVVKIEYYAEEISYEDILDVFWVIHDPTTLNRQGADTGTQYRSVIYYLNDEQKNLAEKSRDILNSSGIYKNPVVTSIEPLADFFPAESYHQNYYSMNRMANPYCMSVIDPKVKKFIKSFPDFLKEPEGGY